MHIAIRSDWFDIARISAASAHCLSAQCISQLHARIRCDACDVRHVGGVWRTSISPTDWCVCTDDRCNLTWCWASWWVVWWWCCVCDLDITSHSLQVWTMHSLSLQQHHLHNSTMMYRWVMWYVLHVWHHRWWLLVTNRCWRIIIVQQHSRSCRRVSRVCSHACLHVSASLCLIAVH